MFRRGGGVAEPAVLQLADDVSAVAAQSGHAATSAFPLNKDRNRATLFNAEPVAEPSIQQSTPDEELQATAAFVDGVDWLSVI